MAPRLAAIGGIIIQPDERLAMDLLVQDRKIALDRISIEGARARDEIGGEGRLQRRGNGRHLRSFERFV
jgi:hypothetical protein